MPRRRKLQTHAQLHGELFRAVDFSIADPAQDTPNEELLLDSFEEASSNELMEKLYAKQN